MEEQQIQKKRFHFPSFQWLFLLASPWILITIPLLLGGMWLVLHPELILDNLNKPYMLYAGPALVGSILLAWLLVTFFRTIISGCKRIIDAIFRAQKEDSSAQFFWAVIVVFMIVSVFASGSFFTGIEHDVVPGLGYVTALFIDLVAIQSMRARLSAVRMRDKRGERLYLFGVFVCAGASAFANVYTSLADFTQKVTGALPPWMLNIAPWFGLTFPALILLLSITADYTLDQTSTKLDPDNYEKQEEKRLRIIEIQQSMLQRRVVLENNIDQLQRQLISNKTMRQFFIPYLWNRLVFPEKQPDVRQLIEQVKAAYEPQIQALTEQIKQQEMTLQRTLSEQRDDTSANTHVSSQVFTNASDGVNGSVFTPQSNQASSEVNSQVFGEQFTPPNTSANNQVFTQDDTLANTLGDTSANTVSIQAANNQMTRQQTKSRRITIKLSEHQRDTDELETVNTSANKKEKRPVVASINSGDAAKRIERILRKTPDISVTDLAKKAEVSRGYASEKRAEFLKSQASA